MTDFLTADTNLPSYMMFPRFLLDMEINETAKMLYIILLDRARLSQKNEGWSDIDGHVFIYFTIKALAEVLHKSQMTVKTALAVLEKQELIFRKRQGPGQPNRIYVKLPKETIHYTDRFLSLRQTENCPIDRQDSFPDTDRKLSGNKKEIKKNNLAIRGSKDPLSPYGKLNLPIGLFSYSSSFLHSISVPSRNTTNNVPSSKTLMWSSVFSMKSVSISVKGSAPSVYSMNFSAQ